MRIPIYQPQLNGNEKQYLNEAFDSGWISSNGEFIHRFESAFAEYLDGSGYAATCCNGTVAIHLALLALGIQKNDVILVPSFTYVASANPIEMVGAKPLFLKSCPQSLQINIQTLPEQLPDNAKAIIVPHLYGMTTDLNALLSYAQKHSLRIIEDSAESLGTTYNKQQTGTFGDISTFSFYGNKTITSGEGGMLYSKNKLFIEKATHFKSQGLASLNPQKNIKREYWHDVVGYNYRMTNLQAAVGLAQLEKIEDKILQKRDIHKRYALSLKDTSARILSESENTRSSYWMICVIFENPESCSKVRTALKENNVDTRPLFPPVDSMPMYQNASIDCSCNDLWKRGINLPSFPDLTPSQIEFITDIIKKELL